MEKKTALRFAEGRRGETLESIKAMGSRNFALQTRAWDAAFALLAADRYRSQQKPIPRLTRIARAPFLALLRYLQGSLVRWLGSPGKPGSRPLAAPAMGRAIPAMTHGALSTADPKAARPLLKEVRTTLRENRPCLGVEERQAKVSGRVSSLRRLMPWVWPKPPAKWV